MDERERRLVSNEAIFRAVNERLEELNEAFSSLSGLMQVVCECGEISCIELISIPIREYEELRSNSRWFAVIPGHDDLKVETVIAHHDTYDVVEKHIPPEATVTDSPA